MGKHIEPLLENVHIDPAVYGIDTPPVEPEPAVLYSIDVVQHLDVVVGDGEEQPALQVAFQVVGAHFAEVATSDSNHVEYRLTHDATGHEITVTVTDAPFDQ